ncbi:hypothetical protein BGHDH14_bgh00787 [Blumeria hordei DH14]|uniref:Uncharacterized protein n=1 Tax=Blumeria graminis f. sp. hordei (strain DH14) TaxID=546991 RepID=N1JDX6_BLUG1|nr:hypothetical protein BGHDH14_bgh00787 [Blumeria hordei DH14]
MGADHKNPPLPAPTETDSTTGVNEFDSRLTQKTSYSLPEDGTPITIATRRTRTDKDGYTLGSNKSQTSLLIEYFEGGKGNEIETRRPSVRVKVTPSSKIRGRSSSDHIQISERKGTPDRLLEGDRDDQSVGSSRSVTEESNVTSRGGGPIEVEIRPRRHGSPLIPAAVRGAKNPQINLSEISSVPENSFLDGKSRFSDHKRSQSFATGDASVIGTATGALSSMSQKTAKTPTRRRSRSLSRERIVVQKVVQKVRNEKSEQRRRKHSSRSRSVSSELMPETDKPSKRHSGRQNHDDLLVSGADSSLLNSHLGGRSGDGFSYRSATSKSSINNPKLLETVEDAIRRLILPELTALKREQSKNIHRHRRGSITSGSGLSKDSRDAASGENKRETGSQANISALNPSTTNDNDAQILKSTDFHDQIHVTATDSHNINVAQSDTNKKDAYFRGLKEGHDATRREEPLTTMPRDEIKKVPQEQENCIGQDGSHESLKINRNNSYSVFQPYQELYENDPKMPIVNDLNVSEITRSSILSSKSNSHLAGNRDVISPLRQVLRGIASPSASSHQKLQQGLETQHSNHSRGNLSQHSQQTETQVSFNLEHEFDEHGRKVPATSSFPGSANGGSQLELGQSERHKVSPTPSQTNIGTNHSPIRGRGTDSAQEKKAQYFYQNIQEVPPPLRYIPYAQERRGLSPIPSVSGWTDGDVENYRDSRMTRSTGSYSSMGRSAMHRQSVISVNSHESNSPRRKSRDATELLQGDLSDSEVTQDLQYWEEQHEENNRNRNMGDGDFHVIHSNQQSHSLQNIMENEPKNRGSNEQITQSNQIRLDSIHKAAEIDSRVASLVNGSELTTTSGNNLDYEHNNLNPLNQSAPTNQGEKDHTGRNDVHDELKWTTEKNSTSKLDKTEADEDEIRCNTIPEHHNLRVRNQDENSCTSASDVSSRDEKSAKNQVHETISSNPSIKNASNTSIQKISRQGDSEDTMWEAPKMTSSGVPDLNDPMPEIGFGDAESDLLTNPSDIAYTEKERQKPLKNYPQNFQGENDDNMEKLDSYQKEVSSNRAEDVVNIRKSDIPSHQNQGTDHENEGIWQRNSNERRRDTLITNPYENTSPLPAVDALDHDLSDFQAIDESFLPSKLSFPARGINSPRDEGYVSSVPNKISQGMKTSDSLSKELVNSGEINRDPFYTQKLERHLSDLSNGMGSPMYDSATGNGIDRIESRDIVALMDHLTVRDAQRSARDTEILVTLVRAAAEMRNSFEDMKRLLADTEDVIITEVQANTEKSVQKVINGPRPLPQSGPRSFKQISRNDIFDDIPAKKRNVFRRALKGLSMKSANDLGKIEEMLVQLLGEVEGLKVAQGLKPMGQYTDPYDQPTREGFKKEGNRFEPERNNATPSTNYANHSGPVPHEQLHKMSEHKFSDQRVSTVPERVESEAEAEGKLSSPHRPSSENRPQTPLQDPTWRESVPIETPPSPPVAIATQSPRNITATSADKCKKHKSSGSSGWIPKMSRWSETTASSVFRGFRSSGRTSARKGIEASPPSRSGSDLVDYDENDPYNADKILSRYPHDLNRHYDAIEPPMSLVPPEDPKFKAHRDSLNLQHPQPRQGPTDRYQTALESQADNFGTMSRKSTECNSPAGFRRTPVQQNHRHSGIRSPMSDASIPKSSCCNQPPPRPPKEPFDLERPPKSRNNNRTPAQESVTHDPCDRPRSAARSLCAFQCIPTRRLTGPRTMSGPSSHYDTCSQSPGNETPRRNRNRETFGSRMSYHNDECDAN